MDRLGVHTKKAREDTVRYLFFEIEHRLRKEEMEEQFNREAKKDGDLQLTQQQSPMTGQAVRNESIHQEESLWQSTAT